MQSISVFLDIKNFADFRWKNTDVSRTQGVCHVIHIFLDLLKVRYNCAKLHHCRICVKDFRERGAPSPSPPPPPTIREQPQKCPSWIGLRQENAYSKKFHFKANRKRITISSSKKWCYGIWNSSQTLACFYMTINVNFGFSRKQEPYFKYWVEHRY